MPRNNFPALLHEGEAVLTASEAYAWRKGEAGNKAVPVATQNSGVIVAALDKILTAIESMDTNMGENLRDALDNTSLSVNNREFGRLVRAVV